MPVIMKQARSDSNSMCSTDSSHLSKLIEIMSDCNNQKQLPECEWASFQLVADCPVKKNFDTRKPFQLNLTEKSKTDERKTQIS